MSQPTEYKILPGSPSPLGATRQKEGVNFALFSLPASLVTLCLFMPNGKDPFLEIPLDPKTHKTGGVWHALVTQLPENLEYAYKITGPQPPQKGHFFNPDILLFDPYAKSLSVTNKWCDDKKTYTPKGKLLPDDAFNWENVGPPRIPMQDLIIYEMHVRGFTNHPSSQVSHPGTFLGIIEKIPYLKKLGVNALELMPVYEFNECGNTHINPATGKKLKDFWGYNSVNFFCLMNRYSSSAASGAVVKEFKELVKELHKNKIEVILDVVYNHTGEGSKEGPCLSYRGIDNPAYYILNENGEYQNYSGCGNSFNANLPPVTQLILDSLRYFVTDMHVDGFRFDLASALTRDPKGNPLPDPPLIRAIAEDPILSQTKLIAEAWDAAGLYQVGHFPSYGKFSEWNGKYRDDVRSFIKGTDGKAGDFAHALAGSEELYGKDRKPYDSINFVIAHDGYTLRDLVSYQDKHNKDNGEDNKDGANDNMSWNCGVEGITLKPEILEMRLRQMKNFITALMVSLGTPMIYMGDEYEHTRKGNNNPWGQDNALNWFLWDEIEKNKNFFRFYSSMIQFRKNHPLLRRTAFLKDKDVDWHGPIPLHADWSEKSRFVAYTLKDPAHHRPLYIAFNANYQAVDIHLPHPPGQKQWVRVVDTSLSSPHDFVDNTPHPLPLKTTYHMKPHSAFIAQTIG